MSNLQRATEVAFRATRGIALESFVQLERAKGTSWRHIAREVYEATGVDLAHQSIVNWYGEAVAA